MRILFFLLFFQATAFAGQIERCLVGEAADQGLIGMTAVGEAIRNRGTLKGVYGCRSPLYDREPQWVRDMAHRAWIASETSDLTHHATHWENIKSFGKPYWVASMEETARIGNHVFYKEIKNVS